MAVNLQRVREHLRTCELESLFIEELGWDKPAGGPLTIPVDGDTFTLTPVADKRGFTVFLCVNAHGSIPPRATRMRLDKETRKHRHEHMIVYTDARRQTQVWQ